MTSPMAAIQMPSVSDILKSVCTLGFVTGVVCACIVVLICLVVWCVCRYRRRNMVFRVMQNDGGELVLTYKAVKAHVRLMLAREYPLLKLKGMEFSGASEKSLRLHLIAVEGANLVELRNVLCEKLLRSFQRELGLGDMIKSINMDVEAFHLDSGDGEADDDKKPAQPIKVPILNDEASSRPTADEKHDAKPML